MLQVLLEFINIIPSNTAFKRNNFKDRQKFLQHFKTGKVESLDMTYVMNIANSFWSYGENGAILPPLQLILVACQGMKTWSEEGNALPMSASSMPEHGEKGKVVGRANFPYQLESWWKALFLSAPVSPCSSWSVWPSHYFKIELGYLARHTSGLNADFLQWK